MSKLKKSYVGKIGFCDNKVLGLVDKNGEPVAGGHYVYIRETDGRKCNVNIITSLEDKNGRYDFDKLGKVKRGMLYSVPKSDSNFSRWSAVNLDGNIKNIKLSDIKIKAING